jgi:hypothetical protein
MPHFTVSSSISIRRLLAPTLLLAGVAACTTPIVEPPVSGGPGEAHATSSGGDGGGGPIAPAMCLPAEAIIVAAITPKQTAVAVQSAGTWREDVMPLPAARQAVAFLDESNLLDVLWIDRTYGIDHTHVAKTRYGTSFEAHPVLWHPEATTRILGVTDPYLVDRDDFGAGVSAYFNSELSNPLWADSTLLDATSFAVRSGGKSMLFVGPGADGALCEHSLSLANDIWGQQLCHPEIRVGSDGHAPVAGPLIVALPDDDVVAVYFPAGTSSTLGATVLHDKDYLGHWSAPVTTTSPAIALSFAAVATPTGEVIVGVVSLLGEVSAIRFSPRQGWSAPIAIDAGASPGQRLAVAGGICGDDALIAYAAGGSDGEVRVARVRGDLAETTTVARLTDDMPRELSIATRSSVQSPSP